MTERATALSENEQIILNAKAELELSRKAFTSLQNHSQSELESERNRLRALEQTLKQQQTEWLSSRESVFETRLKSLDAKLRLQEVNFEKHYQTRKQELENSHRTRGIELDALAQELSTSFISLSLSLSHFSLFSHSKP